MEFPQLTEGGIISIMISKIQENDDGDRVRKNRSREGGVAGTAYGFTDRCSPERLDEILVV